MYFFLLWFPFKGNGSQESFSWMTPLNPLPLSHWDYGIFNKNVKVNSRGVIDTADLKLFKRLSRFSRRIRSHMWNGFSPWIRALGGIVWWKKTESWKSRDTFPLIHQTSLGTWKNSGRPDILLLRYSYRVSYVAFGVSCHLEVAQNLFNQIFHVEKKNPRNNFLK
jgi:hypothetical protein